MFPRPLTAIYNPAIVKLETGFSEGVVRIGRSNKEMQYTGVNPKGIFTLVYLCPPV